jgi:glycyl-tRNA synthetase
MPSSHPRSVSLFMLTMIASLTARGVCGFGNAPQVSSFLRKVITPRRAISSTSIRSTAEAASTSAASASSTDDETSPTTISTTVQNTNYDYSKLKMEDVVSLCKRRGIIFPSSEIYNGFAGFFDYGPLGVELKKNIKDAFWTDFVRLREDIVGLDSSIIHNPLTWKSSGHLDGFSDPMVDCRETKLRYRADQLYTSPVVTVVVKGDDNKEEEEVVLGYVTVMEGNDDDMQKSAEIQAKKLLKEKEMKKDIKIKPFNFIDLTQVTEEIMTQVPSPGSGKPTLTMPRDFNLMFSTSVGAMQDASSVAYLRPETAQGIFINYKNVLGSSRLKLPFGIAQIGKAFRNEITPRNFIFRSREFEQMEIEYFIPPGDEDVWGPYHQRWIADARSFLEGVGLRPELLGYDVHSGDGLAHYARACTDITFHFPFGVQELMGIAARGDYDLKSHSEGSGKGKRSILLCLCYVYRGS